MSRIMGEFDLLGQFVLGQALDVVMYVSRIRVSSGGLTFEDTLPRKFHYDKQ